MVFIVHNTTEKLIVGVFHNVLLSPQSTSLASFIDKNQPGHHVSKNLQRAGSSKAPPGAGCVSQSVNKDGPVYCLQCSIVEAVTAEHTQRMYGRCTGTVNGLNVFSHRQRVRHCDAQHLHGCHTLDASEEWRRLYKTT